MTTGIVFGIQHFSIHDGDGIRSNVFLKGCPLRCKWCHNPEGLDPRVEVQYFATRCVGCGRCKGACKNLPVLISKTTEEKKEVVNRCWHGALELVGKEMSTDEVLEEVIKDMHFFKSSNGGITVSGGEPMLQFDFLKELLMKAKSAGIQTALETSGYAPLDHYMEILPYVDQFLWDYKATGESLHKELTGVSNQRILSNLHAIYEAGAHVMLRCPMVPGANVSEEHLQGIANLIREFPNLDGWELMPYHKMGISKEKRIGKERHHEYEVPTQKMVDEWVKIITKSAYVH